MPSHGFRRWCRRAAVLAVLLLSLLYLTGGQAWAKGKKNAPKSKVKNDPFVTGPLPPLPMPTGATLHFETEPDEAAAFTVPATSAAAATAPTSVLAVRTIRDWRDQMAQDQARLQAIQAQIAKKYEKSRAFPVAERYVRGVYEALDELARLSQHVRRDFDGQYPPDRDGEAAPEPPPAARRVRLYLDKARALDASVDAFLARTIQGRAENVVRIETED